MTKFSSCPRIDTEQQIKGVAFHCQDFSCFQERPNCRKLLIIINQVAEISSKIQEIAHRCDSKLSMYFRESTSISQSAKPDETRGLWIKGNDAGR